MPVREPGAAKAPHIEGSNPLHLRCYLFELSYTCVFRLLARLPFTHLANLVSWTSAPPTHGSMWMSCMMRLVEGEIKNIVLYL